MSMSEPDEDWAYQQYQEEAYIEQLYDEFLNDPANYGDFIERVYSEAVETFTSDRLQSFYLEQPSVAEPAQSVLADARVFLGNHDTAAQVFAAIAAEVGMRTVLIKPIVHGLVHAEGAASLVAQIALETKTDKTLKMLLDLLSEYGNVDPRTHRREGSNQFLWKELNDVRVKRNRIVHRAESASREEAEFAISVATEVINKLFPALILCLGLGLANGIVVVPSPPTESPPDSGVPI